MKKVLVIAASALLLAGCGSGAHAGSKASSRTLTVFAAASLTHSFTQIGHEFEAAHPGVRVRLSFGGSSDLVSQIQAGAPADVFASADTANMDKLGATAQKPEPFATNTLEIAVPPGNPAHVTTFADLAKPGVKLVTCAVEVPCGSATQAVAKAAGVSLKPVSQEQSVTDVLGKVSTGEADAGLVYVTDVKGAGSAVQGVPFPESKGVVNTYPIAVLADAGQPALARQFVAFVLGRSGRGVLADAGFGAP
ncbi:MAG TPA: molybdate ABC transporter substrate-binding protein [Marmoricola sp.]|nr:molybdate ABC transporter substrate-binding protein [Marmoricola sp.]